MLGTNMDSNCLSDRRQKVDTGHTFSSWATVVSGLPQGSVFGSLLCIIFVNDIDGILSKVYKFADDTKLCRAVGDEDEAEIAREDLRRMFKWSYE